MNFMEASFLQVQMWTHTMCSVRLMQACYGLSNIITSIFLYGSMEIRINQSLLKVEKQEETVNGIH